MSRPDDLLICSSCGRARSFLHHDRCGACVVRAEGVGVVRRRDDGVTVFGPPTAEADT